jgi:hypothetical protein
MSRAGKTYGPPHALAASGCFRARAWGRYASPLINDVLDPEPDGFHDPQAAPVEKFGNQLGGSDQQRDDGGDFFACHDHGDVDLLVGAHGIDAPLHGVVEDALVEAHQGMHGLVLGGGSQVSVHGQVGQE